MTFRTARSGGDSFTCSVCGKSIQSTTASLRRHERYCRKRLSNPVQPRQKACLACIHAKSRCDLAKPRCGSCKQKDKACTYLGEASVDEDGRSSSHSLRESTHTPETDVQDSSSISINVKAAESHDDLNSLSSVRISDPLTSHEPANAANIAARRQFLWNGAVPADLLQPKAGSQSQGILVQKLACQILCSYSERRTVDVPFIHRSKVPREFFADDPLAICRNIQRSFATRRTLSCFSVWDDIASEQERIYDKRSSLDKWECLSSAQAVTLYLLMLTTEGIPSQHPTLPITLLFTLGVLFVDLNRIHPNSVTAEEDSGRMPAWEDWIFAESRLRTAITYFILARLFNVEFGLPCDRPTDYTLEELTVTASKALWEAETELAWREEYEKSLRPRTSIPYFPVTESRMLFADLVNFNAMQLQQESRNRKGLADRVRTWQCGMDDFGILLSMCSIMV